MQRCWLKGLTGDVLNAVLCAAGYDLRWLLRAIVRLGLGPIFFVLASLCCHLDVKSRSRLRSFTSIASACTVVGRISVKLNFAGPKHEYQSRAPPR
jgi:hypothetical protein